MPRKRTEINTDCLATLKTRVIDESKISLIRSVDCDKLANEISESTKTYVNGITFKRLYGFTKYPFNPSLQTLDIMCQYIGFRNWYDFENYLTDNKPISDNEISIYISFYDIDFIDIILPYEAGFQSASRKIAMRFREDSITFTKHISEFVSKPYAQIFFVEHFPDYDNLCNYYYKVFEEYLKHKTTISAQIYGNCMLFLKSLWILDELASKEHINQVNQFEIGPSLHPYLIGRYFACNILYDSHFGGGKKLNKIYDRYLAMRDSLPKSGKHFMDFPASEYIVSEALLQVHQYEKCVEIVEFAFTEFPLKMEFVRKGYYRQMQLFWLISNKKSEPDFDIHIDLKKIQPENFYFISQKYFTVLYLYAKGSPDDILAAQKLAQEMGNLYLLENLLNE